MEEGCKGEPLTVKVSPANKKLFLPIRHRRPAGRDPTARRWSPKAKCFKAAAESGVPRFSLHSLHVLHGEVYLSFLRTTIRYFLVFLERFSISSVGYSPVRRDLALWDGILDIEFGCGYAALSFSW